ncbi:ATP-binding cassette domain-containing protein [Treponema phagedenis]|uniref:ATP-binding cassette domain-containing protein n=1 Tax=Treponema phagedenis TaxID=162 RepID=A0AAE6M6K4_TREPH|nr:GTPase [Treponema phagedenis]QEJ97648.1 ATP-binding cassette domain-containing protein [Treponema phagedenis]QEK00616.1 ATP-binding cassette domain-containing protein [Treponema phagedenis]QEK05626.1 ATP-binding cassette domain-containing protein [Treponema phagedenis]QSH99587.1 ATP-binding cassette domain-containing protein [Treponema phagedenis]
MDNLPIKRINNNLDDIFKIYENISSIFDSINVLPEPITKKLKDAILNDQELKKLMEGVRDRRPPRFVLIGDSGAGKSTLINAIVGHYAVDESDVYRGTKSAEYIPIKDETGNIIWEFLDTRGVSEQSECSEKSAEDQLIDEINSMSPDAVIYVRKADDRTEIDSKLEFLKKTTEEMKKNRKVPPSIFVVSSQCDKLAPSSQVDPKAYTKNERKMANIREREIQLKELFEKHQLKFKAILSVSSSMEWDLPYEELKQLPIEEHMQHCITDYRYNIDQLMDVIMDSLEDENAKIGLAVARNVKSVLNGLAKKFTHSFAAVSATVALTPIPVSDIVILCTLQAVLVMIIAALSGRKLSMQSAAEVVTSLGGVGAVGFGLRTAAQQASKFLNLVFPGAGSGVSAAIATAGTEMIGEAARRYYIEGIKIKELSNQ